MIINEQNRIFFDAGLKILKNANNAIEKFRQRSVGLNRHLELLSVEGRTDFDIEVRLLAIYLMNPSILNEFKIGKEEFLSLFVARQEEVGEWMSYFADMVRDALIKKVIEGGSAKDLDEVFDCFKKEINPKFEIPAELHHYFNHNGNDNWLHLLSYAKDEEIEGFLEYLINKRCSPEKCSVLIEMVNHEFDIRVFSKVLKYFISGEKINGGTWMGLQRNIAESGRVEYFKALVEHDEHIFVNNGESISNGDAVKWKYAAIISIKEEDLLGEHDENIQKAVKWLVDNIYDVHNEDEFEKMKMFSESPLSSRYVQQLVKKMERKKLLDGVDTKSNFENIKVAL